MAENANEKVLKEEEALNSKQNIKAATKTYDGFIKLMKWSVPVVFVIVIILIVGIAQ